MVLFRCYLELIWVNKANFETNYVFPFCVSLLNKHDQNFEQNHQMQRKIVFFYPYHLKLLGVQIDHELKFESLSDRKRKTEMFSPYKESYR